MSPREARRQAGAKGHQARAGRFAARGRGGAGDLSSDMQRAAISATPPDARPDAPADPLAEPSIDIPRAGRRPARTAKQLGKLLAEIRACRVCRDCPAGAPLAHEPRPVLQVDARARLVISGQAPGTRVHASGRPFTDPSGDRLRAWLGIGPEVFYDAARVAIVPMGLCFPGLDPKGADLPPRSECAPLWRERILALLPRAELLLLVGQYAQRWHLPEARRLGVSALVADWQRILAEQRRPRLLPLPHPSWRNTAWLKANPDFERDLVPVLRAEVQRLTLPDRTS